MPGEVTTSTTTTTNLSSSSCPAQDQPWLTLADTDCEDEVSVVSHTAKKRKRHEEEEHNEEDPSPVDVLLGQAHSVNLKPPKKAARQARSKAGGSKEPPQPASPKRPPSITCKKSKKACSHEIVFGKHYNKALWSKYADHVKSKMKQSQVTCDQVWSGQVNQVILLTNIP